MSSIKDVAKLAGVGVGTVSRTINNTGNLSEYSREKVIAAMKELNYTPNELARNLYRKKSGIIGVLVPTVSHPFFAEFVNAVEIEFHERGYKTMICNTAKDHTYESEYLSMLKRHIVDGIITGVHSLEIQEYLDADMPIVALDRYIGDNIPVVSVDHQHGGICAAKELLRCGCKEVVQIQGAKTVDAPALKRHEAFEKELLAAGVKVYTYEMEWNKYDMGYFTEFSRMVFKKHPDADGMFGTDLLALGYMKVAQEQGKIIPDDLKIVAYDGTTATDMVYPSLTTVRQPIEGLAKEAVRLMIHKVEGNDNVEQRVELEVVLRRGQSTNMDKSKKIL